MKRLVRLTSQVKLCRRKNCTPLRPGHGANWKRFFAMKYRADRSDTGPAGKPAPLNILVMEEDGIFADWLARSPALRKQRVVINGLRDMPPELANDRFDLAFIGINHPEVDGLESLKLARETWPDLAIVFMCSTNTREIEMEIRRYRVICILSKPIGEKELSAIINHLLKRKATMMKHI